MIRYFLCFSIAVQAFQQAGDVTGNALVALASWLSADGRWQDAVGIARLAVTHCQTVACFSAAHIQGADTLLMARRPREAVALYSKALEIDDFWSRPAERTRLLFCMALASQESNRPRLCATYLYQARALASIESLRLEQYFDPRCVTPEFALTLSNTKATGSGSSIDVAAALDRILAVSLEFTEKLDDPFLHGGMPQPPTFLPAEAREIWWLYGSSGRGGERWNEAVLSHVQLPPIKPESSEHEVLKATSKFLDWGLLKFEGMLPRKMCAELEAWFSQVVSLNSTMATETEKPLASFVGDAPPLHDFVLAHVSDSGGMVGRLMSTFLNNVQPIFRQLGIDSGKVLGLGQVAAYLGGTASQIRRASGAFSESRLRQISTIHESAPRISGVVAMVLLNDVPFLGGGTELWPGAHRIDWEETAWDGLAFEDIAEDGWARQVASVQVTGKRGDCFLVDAALPSRYGAVVRGGEANAAPYSARWLEISLLPQTSEHARSDEDASSRKHWLHPAHRIQGLSYPYFAATAIVDIAESSATSPPSTSTPSVGIFADTFMERQLAAQRFGVMGVSGLHDDFKLNAGVHRRHAPSLAYLSATSDDPAHLLRDLL